MDFLILLTVIGFIISIYQISEESKKRNLIFKIGFLDKAFLGFFTVISIFSIFSANFWSDQVTETYFNISLSGVPSVCDIKSSNCYEITYSFLYSFLAFTASFSLILVFMWKLYSTKLKQKDNFVANSLDELGRRQFSEVAADLELFHNDLLKSYKLPKQRSYKLPKQRYFCKYAKHIITVIIDSTVKYLTSIELWIEIFKENAIPFNEYNQYQREQQIVYRHVQTKKSDFQQFLHHLNVIENRRESYCNLIDNYYYEVTGTTVFLEYVAMNNTDLMFMLLDNKLSYCKDDVWSVIGTQLISDKTSKLHKELSELEKGQTKILDFLFEDVNKCVQWLVWKPIGNYVIHHLKVQSRKDVDEYNLYEEYDERMKSSVLYSGIKFFEIMIDQALKQNIPDHMWLMYLDFWVKRILHNISYENHENAEFSNMYEYYLYLIIKCLRDWIKYAKKDESTPENKHIIEYSIKTIVDVMEKISSCQEVRSSFKNNVREMMIENYFELAAYYNHEKTLPYVIKYMEFIKDKMHRYPGINQSFIDFLKYPVEHFDNRMIWDRGIYSSEEWREDFIRFLDSLSQENT